MRGGIKGVKRRIPIVSLPTPATTDHCYVIVARGKGVPRR